LPALPRPWRPPPRPWRLLDAALDVVLTTRGQPERGSGGKHGNGTAQTAQWGHGRSYPHARGTMSSVLRGLAARCAGQHRVVPNYLIRKKLIALGDDFSVEDEAGEKAFHVDGKVMRLRDTFVIETPEGD
jgi:hypothetical protein